jgi:NAD(P)-dependent dehydrogenase (short-subunit alcohol dehydrogenase family)
MPCARTFAVSLAILFMLMLSATRALAAPTVLVTGANRGIGFELARQYAERGWTVIATAREPRKADALQALARANGNVVVESLDVTSDRSVRRLAKKYRGRPIDVLVNNAGILGDVPSQKLGAYDFEVFDEIMDVNVKGPLRMTEAFIDNVAASEQKKIVNVSSAVGSIKLTFPGQMFYRTSKAALNMATRTLSREVKLPADDPRRKEIVFGLVNPGIVDTGFAKGVPVPMIKADESARHVIERIDGFTKANSGAFLDYKGAELPW